MEFWNKMVNVSEEAAKLQVSIISKFPKEKKAAIAFQFSNFGISRTREWIKEKNPWLSDYEVNLEFVRISYFENGEMSQSEWDFFQERMQNKIKKDWSKRFRSMMKSKELSYSDIALMINAKNENSVKSTISRGLPAFAKLSVVLYENELKNLSDINPK